MRKNNLKLFYLLLLISFLSSTVMFSQVSEVRGEEAAIISNQNSFTPILRDIHINSDNYLEATVSVDGGISGMIYDSVNEGQKSITLTIPSDFKSVEITKVSINQIEQRIDKDYAVDINSREITITFNTVPSITAELRVEYIGYEYEISKLNLVLIDVNDNVVRYPIHLGVTKIPLESLKLAPGTVTVYVENTIRALTYKSSNVRIVIPE